MELLYLSAVGMPETEEMLLSMILSFASDQLTRNWTFRQGAPSHVVLYDVTNSRARLAWERHQTQGEGVAVVLSEEPMPGVQWVIKKPIRAHHLVPFLNDLAGWMVRQGTQPAPPAPVYVPQVDPFDTLKQRLSSIVSERVAQAGSLKEIKLIVAGSVAAGKTTTIHTISEVPPIRTDVAATDHVARWKAQTTVAMDYGELTLEEGRKLRLYGTPGQRRFDFMSKILCRGALGLVILLDNRMPNPLFELEYYLSVFADLINDSAMVLGITHRDQAPEPGLGKYEHYLQLQRKPWPVFPVDPRNRADMITVLDALVTMLEHARRSPDAIGRH